MNGYVDVTTTNNEGHTVALRLPADDEGRSELAEHLQLMQRRGDLAEVTVAGQKPAAKKPAAKAARDDEESTGA